MLEEKSYEAQIAKQKEVYEELVKQYEKTKQKFETKKRKMEFVNDHYSHSFRVSKEELDKNLQ